MTKTQAFVLLAVLILGFAAARIASYYDTRLAVAIAAVTFIGFTYWPVKE